MDKLKPTKEELDAMHTAFNGDSPLTPGTLIGGRKVLAVYSAFIDPKCPDDVILDYRSGEIKKPVTVVVVERGEG